MGHKQRPREDRFWEKVDASGDCWIWTACMFPSGYGSFRGGPGPMVRSHRWAWEYLIGPIPDDFQLDHLCRNRACCNPAHLEAVPKIINDLRGESPQARNARKTHCVRGHLLPTRVAGVAARRSCRSCAEMRDKTPHPCPVCGKAVQYTGMREHQRAIHPGYRGSRLASTKQVGS